MKFIASEEALLKLNMYNLTEFEVANEFKSFKDVEEGKIDVGQVVYNWKNEDLVIAPIGKKTALILVFGQELNCSYEDLPEIEFKDNKWIKKVISES